MRIRSLLGTLLGSSLFAACGGAVADGTTTFADAGSVPSVDGAVVIPTGADAAVTPQPPLTQDAGKADACVELGPKRGANASCSETWTWTCGLPAGVDPRDGFTVDECDRACGPRRGGYWGCSLEQPNASGGGDQAGEASGATTVYCFTCVAGRRPAGFEARAERVSVTCWLAVNADLERASIDAFQILARELEVLGAPVTLVEAARRAEADEVRHTITMAALARAEGAVLGEPSIARGAPRDLLTLAIENAVEGCVRETYGALVAGHQAVHAARAEVRDAMRVIHADETEHAELAWDVHAWAMALLGAEERARVLEAMHAAFDELQREVNVFVSPELERQLGLPGVRASRAFVAALREHLVPLAAAA